MTTCPLCSYEFDPQQENCHSSCPFNEHCNMIMCPACGYEFVEESKIVNLVKSLWRRKKETKDHGITSD
jgi:hypothetical protein